MVIIEGDRRELAMKDLLSRIGQWTEKMWRSIPIHLRDAIFTALLLGIAAAICFVLRSIDENGSFTLLIFVLAVVIISRFTEGYFWGVFSSLFGVICVNFVFTYPFWAFNFRLTGYPLTFLTMLAVSLIISAMNTKIKKQERLRTEAERETMRANLLRAMSHDIRTPLTSIVGNTSAILENGDTLSTEQQRELLRDVNEDAQWLIRMVENLLSITRISGEQTAISKEYEAAEEILAASVHKFEKRFKSNIRIAVEVPQGGRARPDGRDAHPAGAAQPDGKCSAARREHDGAAAERGAHRRRGMLHGQRQRAPAFRAKDLRRSSTARFPARRAAALI